MECGVDRRPRAERTDGEGREDRAVRPHASTRDSDGENERDAGDDEDRRLRKPDRDRSGHAKRDDLARPGVAAHQRHGEQEEQYREEEIARVLLRLRRVEDQPAKHRKQA